MSIELEACRAFRKTLKNRPGVIVVLCPKCLKVVKGVATTINELNAWAFDVHGKSYDYDGRGCCFK